MARTSKTVTISLPPEMEAQVQEIMEAEGRTRSELFREAIRRYVQDRRLLNLSQEIGQKIVAAGITSDEQINELIYEHRCSDD